MTGELDSPPPKKKKAQATDDIDPDVLERNAQEISQILALLLKGIKNIGIYKHAESRYREYLEPAHKALDAFLEIEPVLPLKLTPYSLEYKKHVVYEDQNKENLTYKFYR